jgi:hypothetical protein
MAIVACCMKDSQHYDFFTSNTVYDAIRKPGRIAPTDAQAAMAYPKNEGIIC